MQVVNKLVQTPLGIFQIPFEQTHGLPKDFAYGSPDSHFFDCLHASFLSERKLYATEFSLGCLDLQGFLLLPRYRCRAGRRSLHYRADLIIIRYGAHTPADESCSQMRTLFRGQMHTHLVSFGLSLPFQLPTGVSSHVRFSMRM